MIIEKWEKKSRTEIENMKTNYKAYISLENSTVLFVNTFFQNETLHDFLSTYNLSLILSRVNINFMK